MSPVRTLTMLLIMSVALAACGCFGGGGGGGRTASKGGGGRFASKNQEVSPKKPGKRNSGNRNVNAKLEDLSPEGSMKRDLAVLREREKEQVKVVKEMRSALGQGQDMVEKEEQKLEDIRSQIARFDSAMRSQEMAYNGRGGRSGRAAPNSGGVVPASMYTDRERPAERDRPQYADRRAPASPYDRGQVERVSYRDDDRRADYARARDGKTRAPARDNYRRSDSYEREEVLFDPQSSRREPSRGRSASNYDEPRQAQQRGSAPRSVGEWAPEENLFSSDAGPAPRRASVNNTLRPEPTRKVAARPEETETRPVSVPAAGASVRPRNPAPKPEPAARDAGMDDEVFTPDLYLSGGR